MCEEFEAHQDRSGEPDVLMGQSIVLSEIKADQRQKQNHKREKLLNYRALFQRMNERKWIDIEPVESSLSLRTRSRRKSSIFFDIVKRYNGSGQPDECNSSKAQIRTLLEEQRQTILAECHARVSHHELQAAQSEEERRLLQGQLWQHKLEFREAHQRSLSKDGRITEISQFCIRYYGKTKIYPRSEHYLGTL